MKTKRKKQPAEHTPQSGMAKVSQAAKFLNLGGGTVRRLFDAGELRGRWVGAHRMISWESLHEFARGNN